MQVTFLQEQNFLQKLGFVRLKHRDRAINPSDIQSPNAFILIKAEDKMHKWDPNGHPLVRYVAAYIDRLKVQYNISKNDKFKTNTVFVFPPLSRPYLVTKEYLVFYQLYLKYLYYKNINFNQIMVQTYHLFFAAYGIAHKVRRFPVKPIKLLIKHQIPTIVLEKTVN